MAGFIEAVSRDQAMLFPDRLDDWVGDEHPVRIVDLFVDQLDLAALGFHRHTAARTGRPGYHPAVLLKLFIYGYLNRIPSSRRLEREAGRNVELMWLIGRLVPDLKTIADFRRENGPGIRNTCAKFVELCRRIGVLREMLWPSTAVDSRQSTIVIGKGYAELKAALHRLRATGFAFESPALEGKRRKLGAFNLLSAFQIEESDDGKAKGAWLELPAWLFEAVTKDRDVLAISPKYFDLTSGLDRFLYRLARRHVGKQAGWIFNFRDLHGRSGSSQSYGDFARDLRKAITRNALPEYSLREIEGANGPSLSINRDPNKIEWRQDRRYKL